MKQAGVTVLWRLMLLEDAGGDAAAVAEHDAPVFGPDPDVGAACPARGGPPRPVPLSAVGVAGVFEVGGGLPAEGGGVLCARVSRADSKARATRSSPTSATRGRLKAWMTKRCCLFSG